MAAKKVKKKIGRESDLAARVRTLERRLVELQKNPLLALADVLVLEKGAQCSTVKVIGNLQIVNGMGKTDTTNGCGNLIVGYDETSVASPSARTGSHNVGGQDNGANGADLSVVVGGGQNRTAAPGSSIFGGGENTTNGLGSTILGGVGLTTTMPNQRIP